MRIVCLLFGHRWQERYQVWEVCRRCGQARWGRPTLSRQQVSHTHRPTSALTGRR